MKKQNRSSQFLLALAASIGVSFLPAHAGTGSFTVNSGTTKTSSQTLNNGNTGTIQQNGTMSVTSGTGIQISGSSTSSANQIVITNSGTLTTAFSGGGRAIRDQSGLSNSVINNNAGGLIEGSQNDVIALNVNGSATTSASIMDIENKGTIQSLDAGTSSSTTPSIKGNQALNLTVATGQTTVTNFNTGVIWATAADAVRPGLNGKVNNDGFIYSNAFQGSSSDGIDGQTDTGIVIVNGVTATSTVNGPVATYQSSTALPAGAYVGASTSVAMTESTIEGGRHGITGGNTDEAGGTSQYGGYTGDGIYTMSITNNGGALIEGQDGSGINIDGFGIRNTTTGTFSTGESVSITNYGQILGNGASGDGDGVDVDGDVILNNQGTITSKNSFSSSGTAFSEGVTVGGGMITNGSSTNSLATIEGQNLAAHNNTVGRGITLAGVDQDDLSNKSTASPNPNPNNNPMPIESIYEASTITNYGTIQGDSESGIAVLGTTGGGYKVTIGNYASGKILGSNTGVSEDTAIPVGVTPGDTTAPPNPYGGQLNGQSLNQGAIELDDTGNTYEIDNYGTITQSGASGVAVAMHSTVQGATSNALNIYGGAVNGDVTGDTAADSALTFDIGTNPAFSFSHNISNFAVNVKSGTTQFTGTIDNTGPTSVTGGKLDITGSMTQSATTVSAGKLLGDGAAAAVTVNSGGTAQAGTLGDAALTGATATHLAATQAASTNYKFSLTGMTLDGGSTLTFDLYHATPGTGTAAAPAGGTMFDLGLTGIWAQGANVTPGSIALNFDGSDVGGTPAAPNVYELAAFAPGTTVALADYKIQNLTVDNDGAATLGYTLLTNGQEALDLTVAPEPGTWTLMLSGLAFAPFFWRRIRRA